MLSKNPTIDEVIEHLGNLEDPTFIGKIGGQQYYRCLDVRRNVPVVVRIGDGWVIPYVESGPINVDR